MQEDEKPERRRSKNEVYLHLIWATKHREPLITPAVERSIYRCLISLAEEKGYSVLAVGGMPDHVHMVVKDSPLVSRSETLKHIKGISSAFANDIPPKKVRFRWQEGYAAYAVCRDGLDTVLAYVKNQKAHHAAGTTIADWEEVDEAAD